MLNYEFKTYISDGTEHYGYATWISRDEPECYIKSDPFPSSLLSFLYLDIDTIAPLFQKVADDLWSLTLNHDRKHADDARATLRQLGEIHIYLFHVNLDWTWRVDRAQLLGDYTENLLQRMALNRMAENLKTIQAQIRDLFANVLDADSGKKPVMKKMADYYTKAGEAAFRFRPQPLSFEMLNNGTFAEVLCPESLYDIIDYHIRECVKRELKMRVCKNCGRYFAVTGHGGTEYCDRPFDSRGRTCKEIGAAAVWTKKRSEDRVFTAYRREYKKRFAWIKAGKIEPDAFYAWGEEARGKMADCEAGKLSEEEFDQWLKQS